MTDEEWNALADFVQSELEALKENFVWDKFEEMVQALIDHVVEVCKHHMDAAVT